MFENFTISSLSFTFYKQATYKNLPVIAKIVKKLEEISIQQTNLGTKNRLKSFKTCLVTYEIVHKINFMQISLN